MMRYLNSLKPCRVYFRSVQNVYKPYSIVLPSRCAIKPSFFFKQCIFQPKTVTWRPFATGKIKDGEIKLRGQYRKKRIKNNPNQKKFTKDKINNIKKEEEHNTIPKKEVPKEPLPKSFKIVLCMFLGACIMYVYKNTKQYFLPAEVEIKETGKPMVGGPFDLIDHNGKQMTSKDFFGEYLFVYFGFVNCPDICPLAMKTVKGALKICKEDNLPNINTAFISIDPRDTIEHLKEYSEREENPENMVCLTGSIEKLLEVTKSYRVYTNMVSLSKKIEEQKKSGIVKDETELLVDHSDFVYLLNPKGEFLNVMNPRNLGIEKMAEKVANEIAQDIQPGGKEWT